MSLELEGLGGSSIIYEESKSAIAFKQRINSRPIMTGIRVCFVNGHGKMLRSPGKSGWRCSKRQVTSETGITCHRRPKGEKSHLR